MLKLNKRILIADDFIDENDLSCPIQSMLDIFVKDIDVVCDGIQAYELWLTNKYDFIITDINMPKLKGDDLIKKIIETNKDVNIIVISGCNLKDTKLPKYDKMSYLKKPTSIKELASAMSLLDSDFINMNNIIQKSFE